MMTSSRGTRLVTWAATIIVVAALVASVFFAPIVAAVAFVSLAVVFAIGIGQREGKLKGVVSFLKDVLFGW